MRKLDIIYEDKEIIVINKPSGVQTIATAKVSFSLYQEVSAYVKKQYPKNKIFIVHRLDRDTEGLILFAKNIQAKKFLQDNWQNYTKEYLAVVEGRPTPKIATLTNYLQESKTFKVYVSKKNSFSKLAITHYETIKSNSKYSLLKIIIKTGRKNQIRVQLSHIAHPIVGDKIYGATSNPLKKLCLQASRLVITHPKTKKEIEFKIKNFQGMQLIK